MRMYRNTRIVTSTALLAAAGLLVAVSVSAQSPPEAPVFGISE